ncbi:MAG: beta-galactosidase trimerization domain-containing protein, partial [Bryobacteraceae bacterium]
KYYSALKSMMAPVEVITPDRDFTKYPFVVAPAFQLVNNDLIRRWTDYVRNGGHLILTCRTGQKNMEGHLWQAKWDEPIYNLIGARIPRYDDLPVGVNGTVAANGRNYAWGSWGDIVEPDSGTQVLATYADQFYKGKAAAVEHKLGKGTVTYIGVDTIDGKLEHDLLYRLYASAGVSPANLAPDFIVDWRDGFFVATNFTSNTQTIPAGANAELLLGKRQVAPGGFAVWKER